MPKVLSQAGISLADTYDVEGSIAGVEELLSRDVNLVHEMGATIFSERMGGGILRFNAPATAQNLDFEILSGVGNFPEVVTRVLGVAVIHGNAGRISACQVSVNAPNGAGVGVQREFPIFVWQETVDIEQAIRIPNNAGTVIDQVILIPTNPQPNMPSFLFGTEQPSVPVPQLVMRGSTSGFGAGTITPILLVYISSAQTVRPSSVGLPIPSW